MSTCLGRARLTEAVAELSLNRILIRGDNGTGERSPLAVNAPRTSVAHLAVSRLDRTAALPRIAKRRTRYKTAQGVTKPSERSEIRSPGDRQLDIAIEILRDEVCQSERAQGGGRQPRSRNHWGVRDRQSGARASVTELEAGLIGERTRPGHAGVNTGLQLHFASCEKIS